MSCCWPPLQNSDGMVAQWWLRGWRWLKFFAGQEDKRLHFWYSFGIQLLAMLLVGWPGALVLTLLIGLGKEIWDHFYGSGFCWWDMVANCFGIATALIIFGCLRMLG